MVEESYHSLRDVVLWEGRRDFGHRVEGCPPLLNVLAFAVRTDDPALRVLRKCQDFRKFFFAGATEKIVSGHDFLPVEKVLLKRILAVRPDSVNCPSRKTSPKTKELEMRLISSPLTSQLADGNFANEVTKRAGRSATLMTPLSMSLRHPLSH